MSQSAGQSAIGAQAGVSVSPGAQAGDISSLNTFFVILIWFGLHTAIVVTVNGHGVVPYVFTMIGTAGVIGLNAGSIPESVIRWFGLFTLICLILAGLASAFNGNATGHFRATAFFIVNVIVGYATYLGMMNMGAARIEKTFYWILIILIVGSALEVYGPVKPISDWFRDTFNTWHDVYSSDMRDSMEYGAIRPKFFANEPSILGASIAFSLFFWLCASSQVGARKILLAGGLTLTAFYFVRSPTIVFAPVAFALVFIVTQRHAGFVMKALRYLIPVGYMLLILLIPVISLYIIATVKDVPHYMQSTSFFGRAVAPYLMVAKVLGSHPLWGIGLGDDSVMLNIAMRVFIEAGIGAFVRNADFSSTPICNAFWTYWITFGIAGGIIVFWLLSRLLRTIKCPVPLPLILIIAGGTFWQGFGGPNTPMTWCTFFAVVVMCALRMNANAPTPPATGSVAI